MKHDFAEGVVFLFGTDTVGLATVHEKRSVHRLIKPLNEAIGLP